MNYLVYEVSLTPTKISNVMKLLVFVQATVQTQKYYIYKHLRRWNQQIFRFFPLEITQTITYLLQLSIKYSTQSTIYHNRCKYVNLANAHI